MSFRLITLLTLITAIAAILGFATQDIASRIIIFLAALLVWELVMFDRDLRVPQ